MNVVSVAVRTQVKVGALSAAEQNACDSRLLAAVADDVLMAHPDLCVVDNNEVVLALVADSVVGPMSRVPVHDDRLLWRMR